MTKPPLQLDRSFFTKVEIVANPHHKPGKARVDFKTETRLVPLDTDASRWQVDLDIAAGPEEETTPPPYRIHVHLIGFFSFPDPTHSEKEKASVLAVTGPSILYSQAREFLLIATSRGPWGAFQLPTVSFMDALQTESAATKQSDKGVAKVSEPTTQYKARSKRTLPDANKNSEKAR